MAIFAVFEISTDFSPKCVKKDFHSFASRPADPLDLCVLMAAFLTDDRISDQLSMD